MALINSYWGDQHFMAIVVKMISFDTTTIVLLETGSQHDPLVLGCLRKHTIVGTVSYLAFGPSRVPCLVSSVRITVFRTTAVDPRTVEGHAF